MVASNYQQHCIIKGIGGGNVKASLAIAVFRNYLPLASIVGGQNQVYFAVSSSKGQQMFWVAILLPGPSSV